MLQDFKVCLTNFGHYALNGLNPFEDSKGCRKALRHLGTRSVLGHLRHAGTRAFRALGHSGQSGPWALYLADSK